MAADVHDVIYAAQNPVITIVVAARGVTGQVHAGNALPIWLAVPVRITPESTCDGGPGTADDEEAFLVGRHRLAFEIHHIGQDARHGQSARTGFHRSEEHTSELQ